jgi:HAE1 family hydrophobic/amphiphilic exporter-1
VFRDVSAEMDRLSKRFPPGLKFDVAFETTSVVSESIREVVTTLGIAIGLVVLVMYLFLQNWRTTLIPAITIPVSLIGTFAFVKLFGFSINTLTLFGITLATGLVVDDAIVVIENIQRHIHEYGRSARLAASTAMSEVTGAVIATALVLAAVFVPVAFFPGTTGRLYQQFALTIAFSMALSAFNALTLTPALSALLLGSAERPKGLFFRGVNRVIDGGTRFMVGGLRMLIRVRWLVAIVFVAAANPRDASPSIMLIPFESLLSSGSRGVRERSLRSPYIHAPPWRQTTSGCGPGVFGTARSSFNDSPPAVAYGM